MRAKRSLGFTLLELILTIVIFAFIGMMAVSFFNRGVTRSDIPIRQLQVDASLQLVLENMIQVAKQADNLAGLNANIGNVGTVSSFCANGGSYYVAQKNYVCPNANRVFTTSPTDQFLLVTIKPSASSGVSLSYIFNSANVYNACNNSY